MGTGRVLDRERLVKLLGMTGSAHDGEALNAIRLANTELQKAGATWETLLAHPEAGRREPDGPRAEAWAPPPPPPPPPRADSEWRGASSSSARSRSYGPDPRPPPSRGRLFGTRIRAWLKTVPLVVRIALFPFWFGIQVMADAAEEDGVLSRLITAVGASVGFLGLLGVWWLLVVRGMLAPIIAAL